jgi:hypothetical protein
LGFIAKCEPNKTDFYTVEKIQPSHTDGTMVFTELNLFSLSLQAQDNQFQSS